MNAPNCLFAGFSVNFTMNPPLGKVSALYLTHLAEVFHLSPSPPWSVAHHSRQPKHVLKLG